MKIIRRMSCVILAGILLCGVLAAAAPQNAEKDGRQATIPTVVLEPENQDQKYTMKVADQLRLTVSDTVPAPDNSGSTGSAIEIGSGTEENPGSSEETGQENSWHTDDESVVIVDEDGIVTAVGEGTALVYKSVPKGVVSCEITVEGYAVTELKLTANETMKVGETQTVSIEILPEQAETELTWTSDNEKVLTVSDDGTVTAVGAGQAEITATAENGVTVSVRITVSAVTLDSISISPSSVTIDLSSKINYKEVSIQYSPENAKPEKSEWTSSDSSIAYYQDGKIYGIAPGTAIITAAADSKKASCTVKVTGASLALNPEMMTLKAGTSGTIRASFTPDWLAVTWSSSNPAVAKVDNNGKVTAVKKGTAVVTAKAGSLTAVCKITVTANNKPTNPAKPSAPQGNNSATGNRYYDFSTANGTGGVLYIPGTVIPLESLYTMPQNIPSAAYLTIDSDLSAYTENIADTLSGYGIPATFFVPIDDLYAADDVLRHIAGSGSSIGFLLTADQANADNMVELLDNANQQLSVITGTPVHIVRIAGGSSGNITSERATVLADAGYRLWDWNSSARETALSADNAYNSVSSAMNTTNPVTIRFGSNTNTITVLQKLLPYMKYCGIPAKAISAGDVPVCDTALG